MSLFRSKIVEIINDANTLVNLKWLCVCGIKGWKF